MGVRAAQKGLTMLCIVSDRRRLLRSVRSRLDALVLRPLPSAKLPFVTSEALSISVGVSAVPRLRYAMT